MINRVYVIGDISLGGNVIGTVTYNLDSVEIDSLDAVNRKEIGKWLDSHSWEFETIIDFKVEIGTFFSDWERVGSEREWEECEFHDEW